MLPMNESPLISVIVPIYKVEPWVERCVTSVLNQSLRDVELILVDDCSPDRSMELAQRAVERSGTHDMTVKCIRHERNSGLSAARNTAIGAACGQWALFLDSDDYLPADALEQLYSPIRLGGHCDFVTANYENLGDGADDDQLCLPEGIYQQPAVLDTVALKWSVMACNKLINLDFIRNNGLYFEPGMVHEDNLWSLQLAASAKAMGVVRKVTYSRYVRPGSITTSENAHEALRTSGHCLKLMHRYVASKGLQRSYGAQMAMGSMLSHLGRAMRDQGGSACVAHRAVRGVDPRPWAERAAFAVRHPRAQLYLQSYLLPRGLKKALKRMTGRYVR